MINDNDRISFADSDQFDEDSVNSWLSESEDQINNWRGWKKACNSLSSQVTNHSNNKQINKNLNQPISLIHQAAKVVAVIQPGFDLTERGIPFPEELIKLIAFYSFPAREEEIRLYTCLGCGNIDEYIRGENLYKFKAVKECLQIGFHLSANVLRRPQAQEHANDIPLQFDAGLKYNQFGGDGNINKPLGLNHAVVFKVGITFDRGRITSCHCSCYQEYVNPAWCCHVVAACLYRIHEAENVKIRAPISESLSKLSKEDLQKFSQFLISKMNPADILPAAQNILDALLASSNNDLKSIRGAPDLTAGASSEDSPNWYFDQEVIQESISKILQKFCVPKPTVYGDPRHLSNNQPMVAQEYQNILRPMRGKEPEGIWNLLSIIRDMFRREDSNALSLLRILSKCLLESKPIIMWWYCIKLNQDWCLKSGSNNNGGNNNGASSSSSTSQSTNLHSQYASVYFCDEMVELWRIAALKYSLNSCDFLSSRRLQATMTTANHLGGFVGSTNNELSELTWEIARLHRAVIKVALQCLGKHQTQSTVSSRNNVYPTNNSNSNSRINTNSGSIQYTHSTLMTEEAQKLFSGFKPALEACGISLELSKSCQSSNRSTQMMSHLQTVSSQISSSSMDSGDPDTDNFEEIATINLAANAANNSTFTPPPLSVSTSTMVSIISTKFIIENYSGKQYKKSDLKYAQCEALHYYGYPNESALLAYELTEQMIDKNQQILEANYQESRMNLIESHHKLSEMSNNSNLNAAAAGAAGNVANKSNNSSAIKGSRRYRGAQHCNGGQFSSLSSLYQFSNLNSSRPNNLNGGCSISSIKSADSQIGFMTMMIEAEQNYQARFLLKKMHFLFTCLTNDSYSDSCRVPQSIKMVLPSRSRLLELAFHLVLLSLQLPRAPAPHRHLEVATVQMELDFVLQAHQIAWCRWVPSWRIVLVRIAEQLRDKTLPFLTEVHIPYNLSSFVFQQLTTGIETPPSSPPYNNVQIPPSVSIQNSVLPGSLPFTATNNNQEPTTTATYNTGNRLRDQPRGLTRNSFNTRSIRSSLMDINNDYLSIPNSHHHNHHNFYHHHHPYQYTNRHHHHHHRANSNSLLPPFINTVNNSSSNDSSNTVGFEAALSVLRMKTKITEQINPLLVEGQRRLRDEFAAFLLNVHKDDGDKLTLILETLLDPVLNPHFKAAQLNFYFKTPLHKMIEPLDATTSTTQSSNSNIPTIDDATQPQNQYLSITDINETPQPTTAIKNPIISPNCPTNTSTPEQQQPIENSMSNTALTSQFTENNKSTNKNPCSQKLTNEIKEAQTPSDEAKEQTEPDEKVKLEVDKGNYVLKTNMCIGGINNNTHHPVDKVHSSIDTDSSALEDDTSEASIAEKKWEQKLRCLTTNNKRLTTTTNLHSTGMAAIDSSAPETTESSDNSPTTIRKRIITSSSVNPGPSDIKSTKNVLYSVTLNGEPCGAEKCDENDKKPKSERRRSSSDFSDRLDIKNNQNDQSKCPNSNQIEESKSSINESTELSNEVSEQFNGIAESQDDNDGDGDDESENQESAEQCVGMNMGEDEVGMDTGSRYVFKDQDIQVQEVVTESLAHHMFELAQTVLQKAGIPDDSSTPYFRVSSFNMSTGAHGGTSNSAPNTVTAASQMGSTAQRNLQLSAFHLGVYALGLYNQLNHHWQSRTYSSHQAWIGIQVVESTLVGAEAACVLLHSWRHHLTPSEVAEIAFRVASQRPRARDSSMSTSNPGGLSSHIGMGRVGAELCLAVLAESSALSPTQIMRGLQQCGDQSPELLERALLCVERGANSSLSGVQPVIYFYLAQEWFQLYKLFQQQQQQQTTDNNNPMSRLQQQGPLSSASVLSPVSNTSRSQQRPSSNSNSTSTSSTANQNNIEYLQRSFNSAMKAIHILFELNTNATGTANSATTPNTATNSNSPINATGGDVIIPSCDSSSSGFSGISSNNNNNNNNNITNNNNGGSLDVNSSSVGSMSLVGTSCFSAQQASHDSNIRWTLKIAKLLGGEDVNRYCQVVLQFLQSPFLMKEIILEVMEFLQMDVNEYATKSYYMVWAAAAAAQNSFQPPPPPHQPLTNNHYPAPGSTQPINVYQSHQHNSSVPSVYMQQQNMLAATQQLQQHGFLQTPQVAMQQQGATGFMRPHHGYINPTQQFGNPSTPMGIQLAPSTLTSPLPTTYQPSPIQNHHHHQHHQNTSNLFHHQLPYYHHPSAQYYGHATPTTVQTMMLPAQQSSFIATNHTNPPQQPSPQQPQVSQPLQINQPAMFVTSNIGGQNNHTYQTGVDLVYKMINRLHHLFRRLIERRLQQTGQNVRDGDSLVELILEAYRAQRKLPATDINLIWREILQKIKSHRKCTKDLWTRICTGLQTADQL